MSSFTDQGSQHKKLGMSAVVKYLLNGQPQYKQQKS
jgi:hypothetical protein